MGWRVGWRGTGVIWKACDRWSYRVRELYEAESGERRGNQDRTTDYPMCTPTDYVMEPEVN